MARAKVAPLAAAGAAAVLLSSLAGFTVPAKADCAEDLKAVKVHTAREHDPDRRIALLKLINKAEAARPTSETECRNYVVRTWRLLREPLPAAAAGATPPPGGLLANQNQGRVGSPNLTGVVTAETPPSPSQIEGPNLQIGQPDFSIGKPSQPAIHQSGPVP